MTEFILPPSSLTLFKFSWIQSIIFQKNLVSYSFKCQGQCEQKNIQLWPWNENRQNYTAIESIAKRDHSIKVSIKGSTKSKGAWKSKQSVITDGHSDTVAIKVTSKVMTLKSLIHGFVLSLLKLRIKSCGFGFAGVKFHIPLDPNTQRKFFNRTEAIKTETRKPSLRPFSLLTPCFIKEQYKKGF